MVAVPVVDAPAPKVPDAGAEVVVAAVVGEWPKILDIRVSNNFICTTESAIEVVWALFNAIGLELRHTPLTRDSTTHAELQQFFGVES